jgi:hypothetical protein
MFQETIVLTLAYVILIGCLYAPKCPQTVSPDRPTDYFPVVETDPEPEAAIAFNPSVTDLASMTIRQLKSLASQVKLALCRHKKKIGHDVKLCKEEKSVWHQRVVSLLLG